MSQSGRNGKITSHTDRTGKHKAETEVVQKELFPAGERSMNRERWYQNLFENALVGLFRVNVKERVLTDANMETAGIFGFESVEALIFHVNTEKNLSRFFDLMPNSDELSDRVPYSFSSRSHRRGGVEFWAQFSVRYTESGKYIEGAVKDITDQVESMERLRQAKAEAEQANEAKSRFLATMSHEIRTPLNGIIGFAEIIKEKCISENREYASKILDESDRLMILINQLLDISRLEAEKINLESVLFNLHQVLDEAEESLQKKISQKGLSYSRDTGDSLPRWFLGDPMRLRQVLSNLLSNAVKFTENGSINLKITHEDKPEDSSLISFSVIDTGIGIPEDKLDLIFSSFEQADTSISRKYGGTGLGISISRELVTLMGGELKVQSRVGSGSEFFFSVLLKNAPEIMDGVPLGRRVSPSELNRLKGVRVLLVEDYEINRDIASYHLEEAGCRVFHAGNGREALSFLERNDTIDLIFMDLHMPEMDGLEATRKLRASGLTTIIIGMTASAYSEDRSRSLAAGMDDFITKPLRRADLLAKAVEWVPSPGESSLMTDSPVLRYNELLDELGGDPELTAELLNGFVDDTLRRLDDAEESLESDNPERLHREAHSIKGGALNLMADELAEQALRLEQSSAVLLSGSGRVDNHEDIRGDLRNKMTDLRKAFRRFTAGWASIRENNETDRT